MPDAPSTPNVPVVVSSPGVGSPPPQTEEKKKFPVWGIVLIILGSLILLLVIVFAVIAILWGTVRSEAQVPPSSQAGAQASCLTTESTPITCVVDPVTKVARVNVQVTKGEAKDVDVVITDSTNVISIGRLNAVVPSPQSVDVNVQLISSNPPYTVQSNVYVSDASGIIACPGSAVTIPCA